MLIRSLRAENFMKFRRLEITDVPPNALLGIVGRNEGGKTTIGELIQFALFGKTLSVIRGSILDLIHWDHEQCVVELEFEHEGIWRVWREIDRYGTNYARLLRVDPANPERTEEIATGSMPVEKELESRLRFSFDDFLRSFYLAERDFPRSPERMREFLDRMTGVEVLLGAREAAGAEIAEFEERFGGIQAQIRKNEQQVERYAPNVAKIPELEASLSEHDETIGALKEEQKARQREHEEIEERINSRSGLADRIEKLGSAPANRFRGEVRKLRGHVTDQPDPGGDGTRTLLDGLDRLDRLGEQFEELSNNAETAERAVSGRLDGDGSDSFKVNEREEQRRVARAGGRRTVRLLLATTTFLVGGGLAAVGTIEVLSLLGDGIDLTPEFLGEAPVSGYATLALAAVVWMISGVLAGRAHHWRQEIIDADGAIARLRMDRDAADDTRTALRTFREGGNEAPIATVAAPLDGIRAEAVAERRDVFLGKVEETLRDGDSDIFRGLAGAENRTLKKLRANAKEARKKVQDASERLKKAQSKRDRTQSEIREYQKQDGRRAELEEKNGLLRKESTSLRDEMDVRHLAQELLGETVDSIRHRAGPALGKGIRRLLPYLTDGRYQDLQVTPDFQLRLFTGAKSDFLDTHELSGGTLEGLSFGFRLAFAQAFVGAVTRAPQFLFLDEPFRAMDMERVRKTLEALHRLSDELPQVIIVLPNLEPGDRGIFDAVIETQVPEQELVRRLSEPEPRRARAGGGEPRPERTVEPRAVEPRTVEPRTVEPPAAAETPAPREEAPARRDEPPRRDRSRREEAPRERKPRAPEPRREEPRRERSRSEEPRGERPRSEKPRDEKPREEKPRDERPRNDEPRGGRTPERRERDDARAPRDADRVPEREPTPPPAPSAPAERAAPAAPASPSRTPRRAENDPTDDPSQFLAGIFDSEGPDRGRSGGGRSADS